MKAKWKKGYRSKIDADVAFNELEKIKADNGGVLTAGIVVIKAKKKTNKLHNAFEWDDILAADEYRLQQARLMLRSVEVIYPEQKTDTQSRYYSTTTEPAHEDKSARTVYKTTEEILKDPVSRDELLGNAIRDAISYRRKYNNLSELSKVFTVIDEFVVDCKVV